jgi:hypothetical protein
MAAAGSPAADKKEKREIDIFTPFKAALEATRLDDIAKFHDQLSIAPSPCIALTVQRMEQEPGLSGRYGTIEALCSRTLNQLVDKDAYDVIIEYIGMPPNAVSHGWFLLGWMCYEGRWGGPSGKDEDERATEAIEYYMKAKDHPDAHFRLGVCYAYDLGADKDEKKAMEYFALAAHRGHIDARGNIAKMREDGFGLKEQNLEKLKELADKGDPEAQHAYGTKHFLPGWGARWDGPESLKWFELAGAQGHAPSLNKLGHCYTMGLWVPAKDEKKGREYLRQAAEMGYCISQAKYAYELRSDDKKKAFEYFKLAAEQGLPWAQMNLGNCYAEGEGVAEDLEKAVYWYRRAYAGGDFEAREKLKQAKFERFLS